MLDDSYLARGLDALSRSHETNYFADGHRGAAIVSAYYLCREANVEPEAAELIREIIDQHWTHTPLCEPFPPEEPRPELLGCVKDRLGRGIGELRDVGHNIIFGSLALKVLAGRPEWVTPARVDGLCSLFDAFKVMTGLPAVEDVSTPDFTDRPAAAAFILAEYLDAVDRFEGRGQGWSGHLLTVGRGMLDLAEFGHADLVKAARPAFAQYVARLRAGPHPTDKTHAEHPPSALRPTQAAYWSARRERSPAIGHVFKYPYGFYGLTALASDRALVGRSESRADRVL